jgi:hypothetical protein
MNKVSSSRTVVVLGAGASRGVSYASRAEIPSPLDRDYFDLLQRFKHSRNDERAVSNVVKWTQGLPFEYWRSMEQSFYTLQSKSYLARKLNIKGTFPSDADIVTAYVNATGALLRAAHGKRSCDYHISLIQGLTNRDTILTFNYDLVAERAMSRIPAIRSKKFGPWIYGFDSARQPSEWNAPWLLKLHGSFSWDYPQETTQRFQLRLDSWDRLQEAPGFRRFGTTGTEFPIFLPFWDKRIENPPWLSVWRKAYNRLTKATGLVIWGYSLPKTDLKAFQLFNLARLTGVNLCVIDPSSETKDRWRKLFMTSKFWEYSRIEDFLESPPAWWVSPKP